MKKILVENESKQEQKSNQINKQNHMKNSQQCNYKFCNFGSNYYKQK